MTAISVTIAGSDSGGGAGIQADLKTFSAFGVYGATVLTALTAQNTVGVSAIHDVPTQFIRQQMDAVFSDLAVNSVKIGMLSLAPVIETVAQGLKDHGQTMIVLDPVMVAESGAPLLTEGAVSSLVTHLFPLATLVTPNLHEAARLLDTSIAQSRKEMEHQARALVETGARAVLVKGGHSKVDDAADVLVTRDGTVEWFVAPFVATKNTHGTGCSLSSAIAARLAHGDQLKGAVARAKTWLSEAIARADDLNVGAGSGPVHHFYSFWET